MQYGKTGNSEQKFITEKPLPQKFQIFVSNSTMLYSHFWYSKVEPIQVGKGCKRSIFRVLLPRNSVGQSFTKRP
jgi:hypothetical protein